MKKIIILSIVIILLVYIIYKVNDKNLIDYMVLGDSISLGINSYGNQTYGYNDYLKSYLVNNNLLHKYNNYFSKNNYTIKELTMDIESNKNIIYNDKTYYLKKELRNADLLIISIGMDEIVKILNDKESIKGNLDELINNMDKLLLKIKEYNKSNIILLGYYNPYNDKDIENCFAYIRDEYIKLSKKYNIKYIDIYNCIKNNKTYLPNKLDYHLTSKGYLKIASEIIEKNSI